MSKNVQIRGVPDSIHGEITKQAAAEGLSLNQFLLRELDRIGRRSRNAEVFRRASRRRGKRLESADIVEAIRNERESR